MTFFYDLNKKLQQVLETPKSEHKQLNEGAGYAAKDAAAGKDLGKPGKNFEKIAKSAGEKYGSKAAGERVAGAVLNKLRGKNESVEEGMHSKDAMELNPDFAKVGKKPGVVDKIAKGVKRVADFVAPGDEDLLRDLERKSGGRRPAKEAAAPMTPKQKSFAKLAPPADKITFADKIAGAKKEVDEMLGDVAAEAMKAALGKGKQPTMGEATKEIPGGRRHTSEPGGYGRKDDEEAPKVQTQRGRGRPKKNADSETGEVMKPDWSAFGVGKVNLPKHKGAVTKHKMVGEAASEDDIEVLERLMDEAFTEGNNALGNAIQGVLEMMSDDEPVNEKAVSKKQQKFMGMVHAAQKGEKPASKEVAKVAKEMPKKEAEKFAKTKHKGLPEKVKEEDADTRDQRAEKAGKQVTKDIEYDEKIKDKDHGKKRGPQDAKAEKAGKKVAKDIEHDEKVEETTVSGSVATAPAAGGKKSAGGINFGGSVYEAKINESYNQRLSALLNEEMNVNMSNSTNGEKSLTITATSEDAEALSDLLKMAGMFSSGGYTAVDTSAAAQPVDEELANSADNTEYADTDTMVNTLSGGLNGRKLQVNPNNPGDNPLAMGDLGRSAHSLNLGEDNQEFDRMMEMAGVNKKEVDEEKTEEGNRFTGNLAKARAAGKKEADLDGDGDMEKVQEGVAQRLWKAYKG